MKFFSINKYGFEADSPASALRRYAQHFLGHLREGQAKTIQIVRMAKADFDSVFEAGTSHIEDIKENARGTEWDNDLQRGRAGGRL